MKRYAAILAVALWCIVSSAAPVVAQETKASTVKMVRSFTELKTQKYSVRFSPSGREILSSGFLGTILWDIESGFILKTHKFGGVAIYSGDGKHIFIGSRFIANGAKPLMRIDPKTWEGTELMPHPGTIECMAASDDGKYLLCGGAKEFQLNSVGPPGSISIWSVKDRKVVRTLEGHLMPVQGVAFVPGTFQALSISYDGTIRRWDLSDGKELKRMGKPVNLIRDDRPLPLAVFRDGKSFSALDYIFDVDGFAMGLKLELTMQQRTIPGICVAISPDQRIIAAGNREGVVRLFHAKTGKLLNTFHAHNNRASVNSIDFSPDGQFIATGGDGANPNPGQGPGDYTVRIWKVPPVE
ncbi:MAG: hypothetical protein EXS16_06570 [Gemmataceae bacterium]|nr:hypothetical protein [Gemmataceae bacterium]